MQQASAASFFPTAKELSSGVQWFKDHPVLAAAAATAVSVITYLNALELEAEAHQSEEPQPSIASSKHKRPLSSRKSKGSPSLVRKGSGASDGKLSAAVSWCDEHGGSLTQVFEDDTPTHRRGQRLEESDSDDETRDDVAESYQDAFQQHRALAKSVTMQQLDGGVATSDSEGDTSQTESPQWGWYVAITPPQDQFQATGRGSEVVTCSEQSKARVNTIRRTTSGQIQ